ncbi:MAG TPA: hypothetical protein VD886_23920 [Herpetosiphonaceae bacterium]|nr:hypothetical protein [Herpetosiphonaceae bacterium]
MENQPTYRVHPAAPAAGRQPLSLWRLGRFFLLCTLNTGLLLYVSFPLILEPARQRSALPPQFEVISLQSTVFPLLGLALVFLNALCVAAISLDSFAMFQASPRLRRWSGAAYRSILWLMALIFLVWFCTMLIEPDPCAGDRLCPYVG